jgi:deoxyhypusine synthase
MQQSPSTNRRIEEEFPSSAQQSVLMPSTPMPIDSVEVKGYDFNQGVDYSAMLRESYFRTGFQATEFGRAINVVNEMVRPFPNI